MAKSFLGIKDTGGDLDYVMDMDAGTHAVETSTMTVSPQSTQEDGYIRIVVAGTVYQIPIYAE